MFASVGAPSYPSLAFSPLHVGGNHWTLIVLDFKNLRAAYYDSMYRQGVTETQARSMFSKILKFTEILGIRATTWTTHVLRRDFTPQQVDGYSCGVFVLQVCHYILEHAATYTLNRNPTLTPKVDVYPRDCCPAVYRGMMERSIRTRRIDLSIPVD